MIIQTNMCIRDGLKCKLETFNIFMFTSNKVLVPLNNTILVKFERLQILKYLEGYNKKFTWCSKL
jgi:hypothetical protein